MMDILYYLFYTERKTKPIYETQREEEEKGVTKKRLKKCVFSSGGNGEGKKKKKKSYIRTQERGDVFPKITVNKFPAGDFPHGPAVKNPAANAGDMGWIPGRERFHLPRGN